MMISFGKRNLCVGGAALFLTLCFALFSARAGATDYYLDAERGDDSAAGTSPETAWRTLDRANGAELLPGDALLFRRGELWRGTLQCRNGEPGRPIRYGAYGEGPKPVILGSVDLSREEDWVRAESNGQTIWKTRPDRLVEETPTESFAAGAWQLWTERDAKASL